jgi:hypothetical protein
MRPRLHKLLCPVCHTLQTTRWKNERGELGLSCGHKRPSGLPPAPAIPYQEEIEHARHHD